MRASEDFEMLSKVDQSVKVAMDAMGKDLMNYLRQAGEDVPEPGVPKAEEEEAPKPRLFGLLSPKRPPRPKKPKKPAKPNAFKIAGEKSNAMGVTQLMWLSYKNFKNAHGLATW
jgi:hypothetical protein